MLHKNALKMLFPIELGGVFDDDLALEGKQLDDAQAVADELLGEAFPELADLLLADWERVYGLVPAVDANVQARRNAVLAKIRARRGLDIDYFTALALVLGYTIRIEELPQNTEGNGPGGIFIWRVHAGRQVIYYFRAGESAAGDRLCDWAEQEGLEGLLTELKPAHTEILFAYA